MDIETPLMSTSVLLRDPGIYSTTDVKREENRVGCLHLALFVDSCPECRGIYHKCRSCGLYIPCDLEEEACSRKCGVWHEEVEWFLGCWALPSRCVAFPSVAGGVYSGGVNFRLSSLSECGMRVCGAGADYFEIRRDGFGPTHGVMKYCHMHFIEDRGSPFSYYPVGRYRAHGRWCW